MDSNVRQALEIRRSRVMSTTSLATFTIRRGSCNQLQAILRSNGNESSSRNASTPVNTIHQSRIIQAEKNNANRNATVRRALEADNSTRSNDIIQSKSSPPQQLLLHQEEASVELLKKPIKKIKGHASPITNIATIDAPSILILLVG
eukprot:scaffold60906_cov61-Cyclotella_meneghiniana.AAC.5